MKRLLLLTTAVLALAPPSAGADACTLPAIPLFDDRCEQWAALYDNAAGYVRGGKDIVFDVAATGGRVFVTGRSEQDSGTFYDAYTIAYDATTGQQIWAHRFEQGNSESGNAITASPDGSRIFVTGYNGPGALVLAYDAATGALVWERTYHDPLDSSDVGIAVKATADRVYVGAYGGTASARDFLTLALDGATGDLVWKKRFDVQGGNEDIVGVAVHPSEEVVYVAGTSRSSLGDIVAAAYDAGLPDENGSIPASAGKLLWSGVYTGPAGLNDAARDLAMRPDGSLLYVTGSSTRVPGSLGTIQDDSGITVAFDTRDGSRKWVQRLDHLDMGSEAANGVAVSPDGRRVFVAGHAPGEQTHFDNDLGAAAYDAETGEQLWRNRYRVPGLIYEQAADVVTNGSRVIIHGFSGDGVYKGEFVTVAFEAGTGAQAWAARYQTAAVDRPFTRGLALSPDGRSVYATGYMRNNVAGLSCTNCNEYDYLTLAYDA